MNENKVRLMTRLAIHDKKYGKEDAKVYEYYESDYLYIENWKTRVSVAIIILLYIGWDLFFKVYTNVIVFPDFNIRPLVIKYIVIFAVVMLGFTFISSKIYKKRFKKMSRRAEEYKGNLTTLSKITSNEKLKE